jgi:asparagine synthase (glutamine-hydrolysing)
MCGICGIAGKREETQIRRMTGIMEHRGPDDEGFYIDDDISLGVKRLAIIDLKTGNQPIFNEKRDMVVILNGEIYNFKELRKELEERGHRFYTKTDTEVLIHAYEEFGFECLKHLRGMFSFAIYDKKKKILFLARDRIGIKPLY